MIKILMIGGADSYYNMDVFYSTVFILNTGGLNVWQNGPSMNFARFGHSCSKIRESEMVTIIITNIIIYICYNKHI